MFRWVAALASIATLLAAAPAIAQDDREVRLELAERAVSAMQGEQMASMINQMTAAFPSSALENLPVEVRVAYDNVMPGVTEALMMRMLDGSADIYADIYTREELEALVGFYESPVGQSILSKAYSATPQIIELTRSLMPQMIRDLVNGICDEIECTPSERRDFLGGAMSALDMQES